MRKGLGHINKALEEAQAADDSLNSQGLHAKDSASEEKKKEAIARKMRALTAQIQSDFKKVTGFGDKAGYGLRPVLFVLRFLAPCLSPCLSTALLYVLATRQSREGWRRGKGGRRFIWFGRETVWEGD